MAYVRMTRTMPVIVAAPAGTGMPGPLGADAGTGAGSATGTGGGGATTVATTVTSFAGSAVGGKRAEPIYWFIAYGSILVGFLIGSGLYLVVQPPEYKATAGFDAFAVFYIVAQVLERLFEPVANFVRGTVAGEETTAAGGGAEAGTAAGGSPANRGGGAGSDATLNRPEAVAALDLALATAATAPSPDTAASAMANAATAKATIDQIRANAALSIWGVQSGIAMILCGGMGLLLLRGVGAAGVPPFLDIFVTGIAIGGGSKALHDLIKSVQVTKESKQDPPEAGGAS